MDQQAHFEYWELSYGHLKLECPKKKSLNTKPYFLRIQREFLTTL